MVIVITAEVYVNRGYPELWPLFFEQIDKAKQIFYLFLVSDFNTDIKIF